MRKYLLQVLIISFVFLVPTIIHSAEEERGMAVIPVSPTGHQVGVINGSSL
jgi:hypothetical protein